MTQVAAVILAAGASTRFGQCKQLLEWKGKPLLAHVSDVALRAGFDPVIPVLGCKAAETRAALGDRPVQALVNWRWKQGLATSVQTGLAGVPPEAAAAIFLQCDQPLITSDLLRAMVDCFEQTEASIVQPIHAGQRGTPVLFARRFFPELAAVTGDEGGRSVIDRHPQEVATVNVRDPYTLMDVDTPEDHEQLLKAYEGDAAAARQPNYEVLNAIRHMIIDMDGVLWRGDRPMRSLGAFFTFLKEREIPFVLATNNSTRTPEQYVAKLAGFGVEVPVDAILTSAQVSAAYLADIAPSGSRVYVIGEEGVRKALHERGFVVDDAQAEYVVVGWDRELTWDKLATAALLIHDGADFIATNPDATLPTERGPVPGNGALLAALEASTGLKPVVTGKPEPQMYREALRRMDAAPETTAMLGDRLETDIVGASRAGLATLLVLSGAATQDEVSASSIRPDLICADIHELLATWRGLGQ